VQTRPEAPQTEQRASSLGYLPGLDGLRAISVLAVLAFHHYFIGGHEPGYAPGGFLGVEVFFVVSGYLITALLLAERRKSGSISLKRFWFRRARRLLPALFVMLSVVVLYALIFLPDSINRLKSDTIAALTYTSNWWLVISHQSYAAEAGRPALLKHLWSLAIEEQFYLLWPPLLILGLRKLGRRRLLGTMIGVALASTVLMAIVVTGSINAAYYSLDTRLSGLLLGSAMAFFFAPYQIRGRPGRGVRVAMDVSGALGLFVLLWCFHHFTYPFLSSGNLSVFRGGFLLVDVATLLVIAAVVHPRSDVGPILGCAPLRWIGVRSYSLYLWHYPIFCVTRPGLDVPLHGWPLAAFRLVLSFGAADLSYRYIETPVRGGAIGRYLDQMRAEHGARRAKLLRGAILSVATVLILVVGLGASLAARTGTVETIPGAGDAAATGKGNAPNAETIQHIAKQHNTTTTTRTTPTKGGKPGKHHGTSTTLPGNKGPTTPTTHPLPPQTLAVGDSVMLGAKDSLERDIPGIGVDAVVSRQFWDATAVLQAYANVHLLPNTIVVHMGTNGAFSDEQFDQMMQVIGPRTVFFVNDREPRTWETDNNNRLAADVRKYPNAHLIDWHDLANQHGDWFVSDGIHLTGAGAQGYASLILEHLRAGY
jgi:peptidoglycan/LPS O-acetylase OafA/YrhL